jgi:glycerol-3-phosphate cytidylyltransferase
MIMNDSSEITGGGHESVAGNDSTTIGYVPGAWDMFHIGHLNILLRARAQCDLLIAGVVTDDELLRVKGRLPIVRLSERLDVVSSLDLVDDVIIDYSTDKLDAWRRVGFDVLFKGDDWRGTPKGDRLERQLATVGASVRYFPYTAHTSSTKLRAMINSR